MDPYELGTMLQPVLCDHCYKHSECRFNYTEPTQNDQLFFCSLDCLAAFLLEAESRAIKERVADRIVH